MKTMSFVRFSLVSLFAIIGFMPSALAGRYNQPMYRGYHLDWCRIFENDCGRGAADAFCRYNKQGPAANWSLWRNPGFKTMTIGQNSICDPSSHGCDSFEFIECQDVSRTFTRPTYRGYRLDWCRIFEKECGAPAAAAFCRLNGFNRATNFEFEHNAGVQTMTIGQNSICNPSSHVCDSFSTITCAK